MKKVALIMAGGSGKRMGKEIPKQFIELDNKPILMHTMETFLRFDVEIEIVLVLPEDQIEIWKKLCQKSNFIIPHKIANGGDTRFQSVKNGLTLVPDKGIVFIHDGVRPFVSHSTIGNCLETALEKGSAVPVIPVSESLRKVENEVNSAVNRDHYRLIQTPQTFQIETIRKAYHKNNNLNFTDDASVLEANGGKIYLVDGNQENIKITYPEDLIYAKTFLSQ